MKNKREILEKIGELERDGTHKWENLVWIRALTWVMKDGNENKHRRTRI